MILGLDLAQQSCTRCCLKAQSLGCDELVSADVLIKKACERNKATHRGRMALARLQGRHCGFDCKRGSIFNINLVSVPAIQQCILGMLRSRPLETWTEIWNGCLIWFPTSVRFNVPLESFGFDCCNSQANATDNSSNSTSNSTNGTSTPSSI